MAVTASQAGSVAVIQCQTGTTGDGSPIHSSYSLSGIKAAATDQEIYDVAVALYALSGDPLMSVRREVLIDLAE